jgi:hypothetical protein
MNNAPIKKIYNSLYWCILKLKNKYNGSSNLLILRQKQERC